MKNIFIFLIPLLFALPAHAQSTAEQEQPGFISTSGCPGGQLSCFVPYSASNPLPINIVSGGGGGGTVTTTGTPASGNLTEFSGTTSITNGDLTGDCTTSGTLATTCSKTNGVSFGAAATVNTGTSGATIPLNNGANTFSGNPVTVSNAGNPGFIVTGTNTTSAGLEIINTSTGGHNAELFETGSANTAGAGWFGTFDVTSSGFISAQKVNIYNLMSTGVYGWTSSNATPAQAADTGLERAGAGIVGATTGGSTFGAFKGTGYISGGTTFTASGCSVSALVGGATAGTFTSGTAGTCTVVITMSGLVAPNGFSCFASDRTTAADIITQTASTNATATLSGTTVSGDVISFGCIGY